MTAEFRPDGNDRPGAVPTGSFRMAAKGTHKEVNVEVGDDRIPDRRRTATGDRQIPRT